MTWRFWSKSSEAPDPAPEAPDADVPELDLSELWNQPPPNVDPQAQPSIYEVEAPAAKANQSAWSKVDLRELRRAREAREARATFWSRLKRGDLSTRDIPGQDSAAKLLVGTAETFFAPFLAVLENPGVIAAVIVTALLFAAFSVGVIEFLNWQFAELR